MSDASFDVVVVGMGGAGLCAALSYAETAQAAGRTPRIAVLERAPKDERGGATRYTTARFRIDDDNNLDPTFVDTVAAKHPMFVIRALGGVLYLVGGILMAWNLWKTVVGSGAAAPARAVAAE